MNISDLQTPALLLDKPAMERNMEKIDALQQGTSMALYPHYKSHKCPAIAKLQLARGARGITCAKLSEALDLAQAGIKTSSSPTRLCRRKSCLCWPGWPVSAF